MAINTDYVGRTFEPSEPYEVSRVKIKEFADAIGEPSVLCRDRSAAQAAGYPDVIAPPTFAIVVSAFGAFPAPRSICPGGRPPGPPNAGCAR